MSQGVDATGGNWLLPPRRLNGLTITLPAGTSDPVPLEVQLLDSSARTPLSAKAAFAVAVRPGGSGFATQGMGGMSGMSGMAASTQALAPRPSQPPTPTYSYNTQPPPLPSTPARTQTWPGASTQSQATATLGPRPGGATQNAPRTRPEVEDLIREGNKRMRDGDILEARQHYQRAVDLGDPEAMLAMGRSYDPIYFARIEKKNAEPDAARAFEWYKKAMDAGATQTAMVRMENLKHFLNE